MAFRPADASSRDEEHPRLAVVYGDRSLDLIQIRDGARGWCDLIWLIDPADRAAVRARPVLERSGVVVDALGESPARAAAALRAHGPEGIATFYDTGMEHVATIAAELGLPFHSVEAARALEDKLHQREALRAAGLPTPRAAALAAGAGWAEVEPVAAAVGYPAVLKPRRASGSWHTFAISGATELQAIWERLASAGAPEEMLLEQYLPDGPAMPGGFEADYVSVETVVELTGMTHLAITGRFPLAAPFRETGFFIPATLGPDRAAEIVSLAGAALRALGLRAGSAHTEIKLTPDGPRVIEINGRIGGGVPDMLSLVAGVDVVKLSMRAALGLPTGAPELPATEGVAYRFFFQPPPTARRITSIEGIDRLRLLPGVHRVSMHHLPGTALDASQGTRTYLFAVVGSAPDHAGVVSVDEFLRDQVNAVYEYD